VELGCGTGFVSMGLAKLFKLSGMGIDIQSDLELYFKKGIEENGIKTDLSFQSFDIDGIKQNLKPETGDLCVFNPPHYIKGRGEGTDNTIRSLTRSADEEVCDTFSKAAAYLLKTKGYFSCVITPQNFENWLLSFKRFNLSVKTITPVYGKRGRDARLLLIKGLKNGGNGFLKFKQPILLV
jgi:tRNA1(Val) A37 N6-methylase TrmN6